MAKVRPLPDNALPDFEGKPIRQCSIKITKAGDGLSDALEVAPVALHVGQDVFYVLHGVVDRVGFPKFDTLGDELVREHTVATVEIIPVSREDVDELLRSGVERVKQLQEQQYGITQMVGPDGQAQVDANGDGDGPAADAGDGEEKGGRGRKRAS